VKWYRKAAEQDYADAQWRLGLCYHKGQGVPQDDAEAMHWYRKAAQQGDADAQNNLGTSYANGEGVIRDDVQAYKWINLASAQGETNANKTLLILEQRMPPEQIAEGRRLARQFEPRKETR